MISSPTSISSNGHIGPIILGVASMTVAFIAFASLLVPSLSRGVYLVYPAIFLFFSSTVATQYRSFVNRPGATSFFIIGMVRYILIPTLIVFSPVPRRGLENPDSTWLLFLVEELVVIACIKLMISRQDRVSVNHKSKSPSNGLFVAIIVCGFLIALITPSVLEQYNFAFSSDDLTRHAAEEVTSLAALIFRWATILLPGLIIIWALSRNSVKPGNLWYVIAGVAVAGSSMIFVGSSRQSALIPAVAGFFLLLRAFPKQRSLTLLLVPILFLVTFLRMTSLKFDDGNEPFSLTSLEAYFNGPSNLSIALETVEKYGHLSSPNLLLNDLLVASPLSRLSPADGNMLSSVFFNRVFYNDTHSVDQIFPFTGQAIFHFGWILMPLPLVMVALLVRFLDGRYASTSTGLHSYLYAYCSVALGLSLMFNLSITSNRLLLTVFPALLIIMFQNRVPRLSDKRGSGVIS